MKAPVDTRHEPPKIKAQFIQCENCKGTSMSCSYCPGLSKSPRFLGSGTFR